MFGLTWHSYRDHKNKLKEKKQTTDIHWRSKEGKGSWNYRLIYRDLELPMSMPGAGESEFPRFVVKAFDQDIVGGAEMIGTEQIPELKDLFTRAWRKFELQQSRDKEVDGKPCVHNFGFRNLSDGGVRVCL